MKSWTSYSASKSDTAGVFRRANATRQSGLREQGSDILLSLVIPVYNGSQTIGRVVGEIHAALAEAQYEIILVNDGSTDDSELVCAELVNRYPNQVFFLQLARNFGEHNAVMAGLKYANGDYVAVLDDDGQNGPEDLLRMLNHARKAGLDVVYGRYVDRQHSLFRVLGSWFNDRMATLVLKKPRDLYLSSFKVMSRLVVDEVCRYSGPMPYIDGLILRTTQNVGQVDVQHHRRMAGRSGYTLSKLVGLWMNMFIGFSLLPVRVVSFMGVLLGVLGMAGLVGLGLNKFWIDPSAAAGGAALVSGLMLVMGIQLFALGIVGEYIARVFLHQGGMPQSVLRYARHAPAGAVQATAPRQSRRGMRFNAG